MVGVLVRWKKPGQIKGVGAPQIEAKAEYQESGSTRRRAQNAGELGGTEDMWHERGGK